MASPQAPLLAMTVREQSALTTLHNKHSSSQQLVQRIRIIQLSANGVTNTGIAKELHTTRNTVRLWRDRWIAGAGVRDAITDSKELKPAIAGQLTDVPRPGAPSTFTTEQQARIIAVACEDPKDSNRPVSHWSNRELGDEAEKRGIVESISGTHVGRFLKQSQLKAA